MQLALAVDFSANDGQFLPATLTGEGANPVCYAGDFSCKDGLRFVALRCRRARASQQLTGSLKLATGDLASDTCWAGSWRNHANPEQHLPVVLKRTAAYSTLRCREGEQFSVSVSYPVLDAPEAQSFNRHFSRQQELWFDATCADFRHTRATPVEHTVPPVFSCAAVYRIVHQSPRLLSLHGTIAYDVGDAHDARELTHENYRLSRSGFTPLALADFFPAGDTQWPALLSAFCRTGLQARGAAHVVSGRVTGWSADELDFFTVAPDGLTLYFAPGTAGDPGEGTCAVTVPWPALAGRLAPDGPAAEFLP